MRGADWTVSAEKLDQAKRIEVANAIQTLKDWEVFKEGFNWTGIFTLGAIVEGVQRLYERGEKKMPSQINKREASHDPPAGTPLQGPSSKSKSSSKKNPRVIYTKPNWKSLIA